MADTSKLATNIGADFPIVISVIYYLLFNLIGHTLRRQVQQHVGIRYQPYLLDVIAAFQMLGCSLENRLVRVHYGYLAYVSTIFLLSVWYRSTFGEASANPCALVKSYVQQRSTLPHAALRLCAQMIGAVLAYRAATIFWSLEFSIDHAERLRLPCETDLGVSTWTGLIMESAGCAFDCWLWSVTFVAGGRVARRLEGYVKCLLMCLITAAGVSFCGMYMNPLNASNQSFGCRGTSPSDHLLVYWIGPLLSTATVASLVAPATSRAKLWTDKLD